MIADARFTFPTTLRKLLWGDLEQIVLKALEKEPQRRYQTVDALLDDFAHYSGSFYHADNIRIEGVADQMPISLTEKVYMEMLDDDTYDIKNADPDQMTLLYIRDRITEQVYVEHFASDSRLACFPWFFIGRRCEIEGKQDTAIEAYERCLDLGEDDNPHAVWAVAEWRLRKLNQPSRAYPGVVDEADDRQPDDFK
jgi:hypothetical protein